MSTLDVVVLGLAVGVAFNFLVQIERWLHQHIFKVGWLVTKNFQTTTILYYTFFLPGILVYEITLWLAAGALDVRAERAIAWPEPQEIGELRLNFVQLSRRASAWKVQVIQLTPLLTGMICIWYIGIEVLHLTEVVDTLRSGGLGGILAGIRQLTRTTDFWLWAYFLFAIGNTMLPDTGIIKNWKWAVVALVIVSLPFLLLGVQDQFVGGTLTGPIASILEVMLIVFCVIIAFNVLGVTLLSVIENSVEYITGDSATFKNGRMIVMTREEAIAERNRERENARRRQRKASSAAAALPQSGPPSIYKIEFPIPGGPGKEAMTGIPTSLIEPEPRPSLVEGVAQRDEPSIITPAGQRERQDRPGNREIRFGGSSRALTEDNTDDDHVPQTRFAPGPPQRDSQAEDNPTLQQPGSKLTASIQTSPLSRSQDRNDNGDFDENGDISPDSHFQRFGSTLSVPNEKLRSGFPRSSRGGDDFGDKDELTYEDPEDES